MSKTWIIIDGNALAWSAFHTMGGLHYNGIPTGIAYGFLGTILRLQSELKTEHIAFCFDYGKSLRSKLCAGYKANRHKKRDEDPEVRVRYASASMQIDRLRKEILKNIGFRNVFYSKGFEADDLIASCCQNLRSQDQAIVVSADHDMLQLLSNVVSIYVPTKKQHVTRKSFKRDYGVSPKQWITVKCLAGCSTDEVPGIRGVGEKTAIKYLRGELKPTSAAHHKIKAGIANGIIETNKRLVKLPFENTPDCFLKPDKKLEWGPVLKELNIKSLNTGDDAMPPFNG